MKVDKNRLVFYKQTLRKLYLLSFSAVNSKEL